MHGKGGGLTRRRAKSVKEKHNTSRKTMRRRPMGRGWGRNRERER